MNLASFIYRLLPVLLLAFLTACPSKLPFDYSAFYNHRPRSILVLPPLNLTTDVNAPYSYLSTISNPLAECGYYVFPVAVIDAYMKENGLPSSEEMHAVSLEKIKDIIGADAVLYVTIEEWGQKYIVLQSITTIKTSARLVDTASGEVIWHGTQSISQGSGGGHPLVMLINAVVVQIVDSMTDFTHDLSRVANQDMINNPNEGFLAGPYLVSKESEHCINR
ncbi:MAG: DUF799 family lipoprotein [Methylomicrobium sp.]|nr:DUF799 family lipoprotein [Methylomicrobium sp.]